jgi:hypothetical protein
MTTSHPQPVPPPVGAVFADIWEVEDPLQRLVIGAYRGVTGLVTHVWTSAIQWADGGIAQQPDPPRVHIGGDIELSSDQARELAAALLEAADEIDQWAAR